MGQSQQTKILNAKMRAKEWQWELKSEAKTMDKEIKKIQVEEAKMQKEIQAQAAANNVSTVQTLVKSVVRSRAAVKRLEKTKANMHAVNLQLATSIAQMSTAGSLKVSADILAKMNRIADVEGISATMQAMKTEMQKCADAEEQIEDALADTDVEEDTAVEMQRVMEEMALDLSQFGALARPQPDVVAAPVVERPAAAAPQKAAPVAVGVEAAPAPKVQVQPAPQVTPPPPPPGPPPADDVASNGQPPAAGYEAAAAPVAPAPAAAPAPAPATAAQPPVAPAPAAAAPAGGDDLNDELMARLAALQK